MNTSGSRTRSSPYWFGEGVLPRLRAQDLWSHPLHPAEDPRHSAREPFSGAGSSR
ncbi:hypothetical protein BX257_7320 [Streptomyces sp. 3212.3]|nr:hypothetical protein BX257_7320 [Streptomyces sp. 3212.3]